MSAIPTRQKPGGSVAKSPGHKAPTNNKIHKPDRMGITPNGGSHNRGKGQK